MGNKNNKTPTPTSSNSIKQNDPFDNYVSSSNSTSTSTQTTSTATSSSSSQQQSASSSNNSSGASAALTPAEQLYETYKNVGHDVDEDNNEYISVCNTV